MTVTHTLPFKAPLEVLIACEINVGPPWKPVWEPRTYHACRHAVGDMYRVALGGPCNTFEWFATWRAVEDWFTSLRARNVEVIS